MKMLQTLLNFSSRLASSFVELNQNNTYTELNGSSSNIEMDSLYQDPPLDMLLVDCLLVTISGVVLYHQGKRTKLRNNKTLTKEGQEKQRISRTEELESSPTRPASKQDITEDRLQPSASNINDSLKATGILTGSGKMAEMSSKEEMRDKGTQRGYDDTPKISTLSNRASRTMEDTDHSQSIDNSAEAESPNKENIQHEVDQNHEKKSITDDDSGLSYESSGEMTAELDKSESMNTLKANVNTEGQAEIVKSDTIVTKTASLNLQQRIDAGVVSGDFATTLGTPSHSRSEEESGERSQGIADDLDHPLTEKANFCDSSCVSCAVVDSTSILTATTCEQFDQRTEVARRMSNNETNVGSAPMHSLSVKIHQDIAGEANTVNASSSSDAGFSAVLVELKAKLQGKDSEDSVLAYLNDDNFNCDEFLRYDSSQETCNIEH